MALISQSEWARRQGFSKQYAAKLIRQGKITLIDGMIDEYTANAELESYRNIHLPKQRMSSPQRLNQLKARIQRFKRGNKRKRSGISERRMGSD